MWSVARVPRVARVACLCRLSDAADSIVVRAMNESPALALQSEQQQQSEAGRGQSG